MGAQAGPWLIERELGRGGMGVVYEVRHAKIGKRAALKVMRRDSQNLDINASRMQLEAQVVNAIRHPNIVDIFDVGVTDDGRPYIVMEFLTGRSLQSYEDAPDCLRPDVPIEDAIEILRQVSGALIAAHAAGVVHRDLKPDNIFVAAGTSGLPRVVVLDWGIARVVHASTHHTLDGQLVGTPRYIAPEQARGEAVTAKTDVYALGVVAYELVLSQLPFDADSAAEMMAMHLLAPPRPPRLLWPEIPLPLGSLLEQMLAKRPEDRPTMTEVEARLVEILEELRAQHHRPTADPVRVVEREPASVVGPVAAPRRRRMGLLVGALVMTTVAGVVWLSTRPARHPAPAKAELPSRPPPLPSHVQTPPTSLGARALPIAPQTIANPVREDCSDPAVLRVAERWYMTCTGGHGGNLYPIYESSDLQSWQRVAWIFPAGDKPEWAAGNYWSPELHPTPNGIAAYFSMRVAGGRNAIGVATANTITGPYTALGTPLLAPRHGASDAHVLIDGEHRYLYFKDESHPASLVVQELGADGITLHGEPQPVLVATQEWEHGNIEAPWVLHVGAYFYLLYTGSLYCDVSYAIGVARAKTPRGPFEKLPQPIVVGDDAWLAPGHASVTEGPSGELYLVYHAYRATEGAPSCEATSEHNMRRHAKIERLTFADGWPRVFERP